MKQRRQMSTMTADNFRAWRYRHGLSQNGAARALGLARDTVRCYEVSKRPIPYIVEILCRVYDEGFDAEALRRYVDSRP